MTPPRANLHAAVLPKRRRTLRRGEHSISVNDPVAYLLGIAAEWLIGTVVDRRGNVPPVCPSPPEP